MADQSDDSHSKNLPPVIEGELDDALNHEIAAGVRSAQSAQVNVNILMVNLVQKSKSPAETMEMYERMLEVTKKFEHQRVEDFKARSAAIIDAKLKDPDEIDKRESNRTRRHLKYLLGVCALLGLVGGAGLAIAGGSIVGIGLLLSIGGVSAAMIGPLASGESVSSNDVVRIISTMGESLKAVTESDKTQAKKRKK